MTFFQVNGLCVRLLTSAERSGPRPGACLHPTTPDKVGMHPSNVFALQDALGVTLRVVNTTTNTSGDIAPCMLLKQQCGQVRCRCDLACSADKTCRRHHHACQSCRSRISQQLWQDSRCFRGCRPAPASDFGVAQGPGKGVQLHWSPCLTSRREPLAQAWRIGAARKPAVALTCLA